MTRLGRARIIADEDFPSTLPWFPVIGLAVGGLAVLPCMLGLFGKHPFIQGWLMAGLGLWLTRGLHADGLADVADAWGSSATGGRFWEIMKDSRAGPFGVLALVMVLGGQVLAFGALAGEEMYGAVCFSYALGRTAALWSLLLCRERVRPGLCALFAPGATAGTAAAATALTAVTGLVLATPAAMAAGLFAAALPVCFLARLSRRQGGFNGDFMGAAIVLGELAGALGALAV
ncbi:MAG: adenosylcobinamide-GDP ribazoletransferase [Thermodesulfobacteriota bacterium]